MRSILTAAACAALLAGSGSALAAPCKDARGRFVKCPKPAAAAPARCKNAQGRFARCGTPGARPA